MATSDRKTLIVGDLHGRYEIAEKALSYSNEMDIVFVGDYLDSYDRTNADQLLTLELVVEAVKEEKAVALFGNHELSYLDSSMRCSGYSRNKEALFLPKLKEAESLFKYYYWLGDILITHAGVSAHYLNEDFSKENINTFLEHPKSSRYIGYARGGLSPVGGYLWCDFWREMEPVPNLTQIVGHSGWRPKEVQGIGIYELLGKEGGSVWNVDCFEHRNEFLLVNEDTSIEILKF